MDQTAKHVHPFDRPGRPPDLGWSDAGRHGKTLWGANIRPSRGEVVLVDQPAEPVVPLDWAW